MVGYFSDFSDFTNLDPQKSPCFLTSPDPILEDKAKLSYSQSCCKEKWTKNITTKVTFYTEIYGSKKVDLGPNTTQINLLTRIVRNHL